MSKRPHVRSGYTLIETMVVFAILSVLTALIVPAVQKVRSAAERVQCCNNLKNIGIAAWNYHEIYRKLPPACVMPYAQPAAKPSIADVSGVPPLEMINDSAARINSDPRYPFGPNWAVYLLPYLEQSALFEQARISDYFTYYSPDPGPDDKRDRWRSIVKNAWIPTYQCPSDYPKETPFVGYKTPLLKGMVSIGSGGTIVGGSGGGGLLSGVLGTGSQLIKGVTDPFGTVSMTLTPNGPWARGNYAANAGPGWWQLSLNGNSYTETYGSTGPMMGINFGANLPKISDGTSNTIMFSEVRIGVSDQDPRGVWAMGYPGSSVVAANAIGDSPTPNDNNEESDDVQSCPSFWYAGIGSKDRIGCGKGFLDLGWASWQAQARSRHPGGVHCCFGDGSVRFVSNYVPQATWFAMLSTKDGVPYSYQFD